jgi:hypothetical protein
MRRRWHIKSKRKRGWRTSPTGINETCELELPGSGQPPGGSRASGPPEVREGECSIPVGNKARQGVGWRSFGGC